MNYKIIQKKNPLIRFALLNIMKRKDFNFSTLGNISQQTYFIINFFCNYSSDYIFEVNNTQLQVHNNLLKIKFIDV